MGGKRTGFSVWATGFRGGAQLVSPGYGGATYYFMADAPDRLRQSENLFYNNPVLSDRTADGARASVRIDGRDAFDPAAVADLYEEAPAAPGFRELRVDGVNFDRATGTMIVDASSPPAPPRRAVTSSPRRPRA